MRKINMTDNDYAAALYCQVFDEHTDMDNCNTIQMLNALNTLSERERKVLEFRIRNGLTLEKTAAEFCVTRERIRQIEAKAIRKLRHPSRAANIRVNEIVEQRNSLRAELDSANAVIRQLQEIIVTIGKDLPEGMELKLPHSVALEDMDLSVRSFNCLRRVGARDALDIADMDAQRLLHVRNLGRKSVEEVLRKMRELGFTEWAAKVEDELYGTRRTVAPEVTECEQ